MSKWTFKIYNSPKTLLEEQPSITRKINKIVLHYTAVPHAPIGKALAQLEAIDTYHKNKGWTGIGYHIAVHPSGHVISCRPLNLSGAHCRGHNRDSVGVVMMTDADYLQTNPPLLMWVVVDTLKTLCQHFGISRESVFLHKQYNKTDCPPITQHFEKYLHEAGFKNINRLGGGNIE